MEYLIRRRFRDGSWTRENVIIMGRNQKLINKALELPGHNASGIVT